MMQATATTTEAPRVDEVCVRRIREELGDMERGQYRYFVPAMTGEETGNPDSPMEDYRRMEAYNRDDWAMYGVVAKAEVSRPIGNGCRRIETFSSGGLWGIESDSDDSYFAEVAAQELADLKGHLEAFGVDTSNWADLTADCGTGA